MRFKAPKLYNRVILAAFCLYFYPHLRYNGNSVNLPSFLRYPFKKFCSSHNSLSVFLHLTYSFFYCEKTARKCLFFRGMTSGHHTPRNGLPRPYLLALVAFFMVFSRSPNHLPKTSNTCYVHFLRMRSPPCHESPKKDT